MIKSYDPNAKGIHADEELYTATLHNADGDALEVEDDANGFEDMVVAIEFSGLREARP